MICFKKISYIFFLNFNIINNFSEDIFDQLDPKPKTACKKFCVENEHVITPAITIGTSILTALAVLGAQWYAKNKPYWDNIKLNKRIVEKYKKFLSFKKDLINIDECIERYDIYSEKVKGQDIIKKKIRNYLLTVLDDIKENRKNGPHIFYFTGDSGTGKTMLSNVIIRSIAGKNGSIFTIRPGDFCADRGLFSDQILLGEKYYVSKTELRKISKFVAYIKACKEKGTIPIIFFDEIADIYDKFDDKTRQINQVEDFLQLIFDNNGFQYQDDFFNLENAIFIFNSNEFIDNKASSDNSRINIRHKKAFLNRLTVIDFDPLTEDNFKEILDDKLTFLLEKSEANNISYDDNFLTKIAKVCYQKKQGGRIVNKYIRFLKSKIKLITNENKELIENNKKDKIQQYKLEYDSAVDDIIIHPI